MQLTAEQKIRLALTGDPFTDPVFQHEGEAVVRWLTGGNEVDTHATFHPAPDGVMTVAHCPVCGFEFGRFYTDDREGTGEQLGAIRRVGHAHEQEHQ